MKLPTGALAAAAALLPQVHGCVYVHTYMQNNPLTSDNTQITARINGQVVCNGGVSEFLAGENSKGCLRNHDGKATNPRCAPGYVACVWGNGASTSLEYWGESGSTSLCCKSND